MATRGYFSIKNDEYGSKDPYYGFPEEYFLVEAHHDGYLRDMLQDFLSIPERAAKLSRLSGNRVLLAAEFNPDVAHYIYEDEHTMPYSRFARISPLSEFVSWCYQLSNLPAMAANHAVGVIEYLQRTRPGKYARIQPGVTRYGEPVILEDAEFTIEMIKNGEGCKINAIVSNEEEKESFKSELKAALQQCRATSCAQTYSTKIADDGLTIYIPLRLQSAEMYWYDYIRPFLTPAYKAAGN